MRIKELRRQGHMSQKTLAERMGVSRSPGARWEAGTQPGGATLRRLADLFGVTLDYLMERPASQPPTPEEEELWDLRERLRRQPGMRMLFSVTRDASEADLKQAVAIIEALKRTGE